jgi:hypothetical protein
MYKTAFEIPNKLVRDANLCAKETYEDGFVLSYDLECEVLSLIDRR